MTQATTIPTDVPQPVTYRRSHRHRARLAVGMGLLVLLALAYATLGSERILLRRVISESMEPTLLVGDVLAVDTDAVVRRYAIVDVLEPRSRDEYVKRVVGMPGDIIELREGRVHINGRPEVFHLVTDDVINWRDLRIEVPAEHVFVLGDNRNNSYDSLNFGPVPYGDVRGVITRVVWPPKRWSRPSPGL